MRIAPLDEWPQDDLTWLEQHIIAIQDAIGNHFPWCDASIPGENFICTCGMDEMRVNRATILNLRAYGTPTPEKPHSSEVSNGNA
jgi:hypothetical protein